MLGLRRGDGVRPALLRRVRPASRPSARGIAGRIGAALSGNAPYAAPAAASPHVDQQHFDRRHRPAAARDGGRAVRSGGSGNSTSAKALPAQVVTVQGSGTAGTGATATTPQSPTAGAAN